MLAIYVFLVYYISIITKKKDYIMNKHLQKILNKHQEWDSVATLYENMFDKKIAFYYPKGDETNLMKRIDIKHLQFVKNLIKKYKLKLRIRYRGSSTDTYKRNPSFMHMNNATSFAVYER